MPRRDEIIVIGGGLIGLATARALLHANPSRTVTVLEKENEPGQHQSTHNSGVLHAGLYYKPGSLKADFSVRGIRAMTSFCRDHGVAHEVCGKLVVATDAAELPRLKALLERGTANGLTGLRWLEREQANEIEPNVQCLAAVHVPEEGIADYRAVIAALVAEIQQTGATVRTSSRVRELNRDGTGWRVVTDATEPRADVIVNCAGLHSDRVALMAGEDPPCRIVPFRGEYFFIRPDRRDLVRNLVYPVPDPQFPFLGVHFTRTTHGDLEAGPNAVLAFSREGYRHRDISLRDLAGAVGYSGLRRFIAKYPRQTLAEFRRSLSSKVFLRSLQRLVPSVQKEDLMPGLRGVRAQAMAPDGSLIDDFLIVARANAVHLLNAPSPGATASLVIGEHVASHVVA
ncbi:MAG TPA: L-2-hydroxyglutarate oxidase [Gemmatimonadaceae bacterium]